MQRKVFIIIIFLLTALIFSVIFPYPVLSNYTNINEKILIDINNYHEVELQQKENQTTEILNLSFEEIDHILPINSLFEIVDIDAEQNYLVKRIGGIYHFDVENVDKSTHISTENHTRNSVLVKVNDFCYLPASLDNYEHGYAENNGMGHFCLHFLNSKTDTTKNLDPGHQKAIKKALEKGTKYLKELI